ncbi:MAG TPA: ubiquinol-cytochrome c reductase iron-sulfur subunit [Gammaproteobacteria bacterium]|nr:ubiquinol-cytochrome c reductase iron-sulfur subunit [Gammaproteobacteria bacterium]
MSSEEIDKNRRHFLTVATVVVGAVGTVMTAVPFVSSMEPSARAKALGGPVDIDISKIEPGGLVKVKWRGKPTWVVQRSQAALDALPQVDPRLRDPDSEEPQQPPYARNGWRSIKPGLFVVVGICTHLGCSPLYKPQPGDPELGTDWPGGFHCPCHGSLYDLAGRVFKNVPAPLNLPVPQHYYVSDTVIRIGQDPAGSSSSWTTPLQW